MGIEKVSREQKELADLLNKIETSQRLSSQFLKETGKSPYAFILAKWNDVQMLLKNYSLSLNSGKR